MREIKFRVLIDHRIYYQDKYNAYSDNLASIDICKKTITINSFYNYEDVYRFEDEEVKLMQYTGLNDKNGKEIYENDLISCNKYKNIVVFFENGCFKVKYSKNDTTNVTCTLDTFLEKYKCKISGNVYENKNLLEENKWANTK